MKALFDSQRSLVPSRILTLAGRGIAEGLLYAESPEGQFQATEISDQASIESSTEILVEIGTHRLHLVEWQRCTSPFSDHFHFRVKG
jgi:hypothetical protein